MGNPRNEAVIRRDGGSGGRAALVNGRTPRPQSFCALCCEPLGESYLREAPQEVMGAPYPGTAGSGQRHVGEPPSLPSCPAQRSLRRSEPSQPLSSADGAVSPRSNAHTHEIKPVNWKWRQQRCEKTLRAMVGDNLLYGVWQIS